MDALLAMDDDALGGLGVHALKAVLVDNHVNAQHLLEKRELVAKVRLLLEEERRERVRAEEAREAELREERERQVRVMQEIEERQRKLRGEQDAEASAPPAEKPKPVLPPERQGVCVVCQDEDSCLAIIDCGHLCMCKTCSDLIMNSTRECPLCRTRIISDARLLRIYRT